MFTIYSLINLRSKFINKHGHMEIKMGIYYGKYIIFSENKANRNRSAVNSNNNII